MPEMLSNGDPSPRSAAAWETPLVEKEVKSIQKHEVQSEQKGGNTRQVQEKRGRGTEKKRFTILACFKVSSA